MSGRPCGPWGTPRGALAGLASIGARPPGGSPWLEVLEAGRLSHDAVAVPSRPDCLDGRQDWWALADRAAWRERVLELHPELAGVGRRLHRALEPLGPAQLVHGDLAGNVLLSGTLLPAVIDISPYWRPREYAAGVVVADALCWHDASPSLVEESGISVAAVARALLFRMATTHHAVAEGAVDVDLHDDARRYNRAATTIGL